MFKIHSILLTNNEADILAECIDSALKWSDYIYIFDTGSTDKTLEIINSFTLSHTNIILYKSEYRLYNFTKNISEVFSYYFKNSSIGDWWCTLCTDEQYPEDPRIFLAKVPLFYNNVLSNTLNYYFTENELKIINQDPKLSANDFSKIKYSLFLKYYKNNYSEVRFYRHYKNTFHDTLLIPKNFKYTSPNKITLQHFQYRSPSQIISRVRSRLKIYDQDKLKQFKHEFYFTLDDNGFHSFKNIHLNELDFANITDSEILKSRIIDSSKLNYDNKDNKFIFNFNSNNYLYKMIIILKSLIINLNFLKKY